MPNIITARRIEGRDTVVVERTPPLPRKLGDLLAALQTTARNDIRPSGASRLCGARIHEFGVLREGRYTGPDGRPRDLVLQMCVHCGAVCVRDVSPDYIEGVPTGRGGPLRRDLVLGWYSGARPAGRQYS